MKYHKVLGLLLVILLVADSIIVPVYAGILEVLVGIAVTTSFLSFYILKKYATGAQEVVNVTTVDWGKYQEQVSEILWNSYKSAYTFSKNYPQLIKFAYTYWARWAEALASAHYKESEWSDDWIYPVLRDMRNIFMNCTKDLMILTMNLVTQIRTLYECLGNLCSGYKLIALVRNSNYVIYPLGNITLQCYLNDKLICSIDENGDITTYGEVFEDELKAGSFTSIDLIIDYNGYREEVYAIAYGIYHAVTPNSGDIIIEEEIIPFDTLKELGELLQNYYNYARTCAKLYWQNMRLIGGEIILPSPSFLFYDPNRLKDLSEDQVLAIYTAYLKQLGEWFNQTGKVEQFEIKYVKIANPQAFLGNITLPDGTSYTNVRIMPVIVPEGFTLNRGSNIVNKTFWAVIQTPEGVTKIVEIPQGTLINIAGWYTSEGTLDNTKNSMAYQNLSLDEWWEQNVYVPQDLREQFTNLSDWDLIKLVAKRLWNKYKLYILIGLFFLFLLLLLSIKD